MLLEYASKGSLIQLLMNVANVKQELSPATILYLFKQTVKAIHDFRTLTGKAYLDVKPDNFVLKRDYTVALIDFGHAT